ncbi:Piso0_003854 [Millerozyma farinosa CBS 7064]|uniref:Piso0_003854 protein n=1 Tax=Pichia sorbitophila (strain ATCC MYA-4447 / BCRC 22081 / CBS 7064 / NBRC 10061 / NRRL Y-12695) TaxID=559304 RepID=G8Y9P9_PICSO|nr:Piso0_003854 [Millerozyma farinosa CBS 7064]CCE84313.1 Piso0_003854 [Millerozyma farinosa CBS 7064]
MSRVWICRFFFFFFFFLPKINGQLKIRILILCRYQLLSRSRYLEFNYACDISDTVDMTWEPTESFIHGKIIKAFLPFDKHPNLRNDNFKNLYPGDEVYVFEVKDDKWARGYALSRPAPMDFTVTSVNLDELPTQILKICVFPLKYVKVLERIEFSRPPSSEVNLVDENNVIPTIYESETAYREALGGDQLKNGQKETSRRAPALPILSFKDQHDIVQEITYTLSLLNTHIFALYSMGEYRLFDKLTKIYFNLDDLRIKLSKNILTSNELQIAKENAIFLLNKIPKKLASDADRLALVDNDTDNEVVDTSGYKAILARDSSTGSLLSTDHTLPPMIALHQIFCALAPNFPLKAHLNQSEYQISPPLNKIAYSDAPSHILVEIMDTLCPSNYEPPGFTGLTAYLHLRNNQKRLTEVYAITANSFEELAKTEKVSAALFKNLPASEIDNRKVYLAILIVEEISLKGRERDSPIQLEKIRRGVAAGVTDITRIIMKNSETPQSNENQEFTVKLFSSYLGSRKSANKPVLNDSTNNGWGELVDRIIDGSTKGVAVNPRIESIKISIKKYSHKAINKSHNLLGRSSAISRIGPMIFDPLAENYERVYLKFGRVILNSPNKDDLLTVEINPPANEGVTFYKASNQRPQSKWQFPSVAPDESIGEIVKLNGFNNKNAKKFQGERYIGVYLYVNGILAGEGRLLYKSGDRMVELNKKGDHEIQVMSITNKIPIAKIEVTTEYIGKFFNSDSSIQNIFDYEKLLQGSQRDQELLSESLVSFSKLELHQLIKYFPELVTCLFSLIDYTRKQKSLVSMSSIRENAFKGLVILLDVIFGKNNQYSYLMEKFTTIDNLAPIGVYVLQNVCDIFSNAEKNWNSTSRSLCRVLYPIIKLSALSVHDSEDQLEAFTRTLDKTCKAISYFLSVPANSLITDQILILETVDYIFTSNIHLDKAQAVKYISLFIDSIGLRGLGIDENQTTNRRIATSFREHEIVTSKLLLINRLYTTNLKDSPSSRYLLVSNTIRWALEIFSGPTDVDAVRLACSIFNSICTLLWDAVNTSARVEDVQLCYLLAKLLPVITKTFIKYYKYTRQNNFFKSKRIFTRIFPSEYPFKEYSVDPDVNQEVLVEVLVELSSIFCFVAQLGKHVSEGRNYNEILDSPNSNEYLNVSKYLQDNFKSKDLNTLISGINLIRQGSFIPESKWLSLHSVNVQGCLVALEIYSGYLKEYYLPPIDTPEKFSRHLWGGYLKALLKLACAVPVSIEHLSDIPKNACHQITRNMRDRIAVLLGDAWDSLAWEASEESSQRFGLSRYGGYQVEFINNDHGIIQDLMLFALQQNRSCQHLAAKILWSIMVADFIMTDSVEDIETECLTGLYRIYCGEQYKPSYNEQQSFIEILKQTIRLDREDEVFSSVYAFIESLSGFLEQLNELTSVPIGREFDNDRTFHKLNINAYLKKANKPELFNSFIHNMYEDYVRKGDHVQAALSLELLAATYSWNPNDLLPPSVKPKFPEQSSFERKEALFNMIAESYMKGNSLERALDTYNDLLVSYNEHTYDLKSLAQVHSMLSKLYLELESSDKLTPTYFKVSFIGGGFPKSVRGKEQIYEGLPFEHITSIHERLLRMYPGAIVISDESEAQTLSEKVSTGRYLYITTVEPVNEISDKLFNTSLGVRQYAKNKDLRYFTTLRKLPGATSVYDLWTEETTYETQQLFPTLMNRSDIKSSKKVRLSPLDNAIRTIVRKNEDLIQLESMVNVSVKKKADITLLLNDLSRQLVGTVDSPVNGGVGQYRGFFTDAAPQEEVNADKLRLLKDAFNDLALILHRCLVLHGHLIYPQMRASHDMLVDLFKNNFKDEINTLGIPANYDISVLARYPQSVSSSSDKRSIAPSFASNSIMGGASKLHSTISRTSSLSSSSAISGISSIKTSHTGGSTGGSTIRTTKRTAFLWKSAIEVGRV